MIWEYGFAHQLTNHAVGLTILAITDTIQIAGEHVAEDIVPNHLGNLGLLPTLRYFVGEVMSVSHDHLVLSTATLSIDAVFVIVTDLSSDSVMRLLEKVGPGISSDHEVVRFLASLLWEQQSNDSDEPDPRWEAISVDAGSGNFRLISVD